MAATDDDISTQLEDDIEIGDQIVVNGINGATGDYLVQPISIENAVQVVADSRQSAEDIEKDKIVSVIRQKAEQKSLGLADDVDPDKLHHTGWAIVFHKDEDPQVKAALKPLFEHRLKMIQKAIDDDDEAENDAKDIVKWCEDYKDQTAHDWLVNNHGIDFGNFDAAKMPYYILLVGSPERIPFKFGHWLGAAYGVGRLYFDQIGDYQAYVDSVIRYEKEAEQPAPTTKDLVFFGPRQRNDGATKLSSEFLVKPLATDNGKSRVFKKLVKAGYRHKLISRRFKETSPA